MARITRRRAIKTMGALTAAGLVPGGWHQQANAACCYFAAKDKDVNQPAQKAFLTWNSDKQQESFTVQPKFEGDAGDFVFVLVDDRGDSQRDADALSVAVDVDGLIVIDAFSAGDLPEKTVELEPWNMGWCARIGLLAVSRRLEALDLDH